MNMNNRKALFEEITEAHKALKIPVELSNVVQHAIAKGRNEQMNTNTKNKQAVSNEKGFNFKSVTARTALAFAAALIIFTAGVNLSPTFANQFSQIPILGELVKVLTFTDGKASGGKITDGTNVSGISISESEGVEQLTLNFEQGGVSQNLAGAYEIKYQEKPYTMSFKVSGARMLSAMDDFENIKKSPSVKDIYRIITLDDSMVRFMIVFNGPIRYEIKEMKSPSSLVLSILPGQDSEAAESKKIVLKTSSIPQGEGLAMVEETLMTDYPDARVLRADINSENYYVEIGQYATESEASAAKAALKTLESNNGLTLSTEQIK